MEGLFVFATRGVRSQMLAAYTAPALSSLSLEAYSQIQRELTGGGSAVQQLSAQQNAFIRAQDLKHVSGALWVNRSCSIQRLKACTQLEAAVP